MYKGKHVTVIIAGGGVGARFGSGDPKQFAIVGDKTMMTVATEKFLSDGHVDEIIITAPEGYVEYAGKLAEFEFGAARESGCLKNGGQKLRITIGGPAGGRDIPLYIICGGKDRAASVRAALDAAEANGAATGGLALIHDAARPYVSGDVIERVLEGAYAMGAAIPAVPVCDTIYIEGEDGFAAGIPDRSALKAVQTPQGFSFDLIKQAHEKALTDGLFLTDDGMPVFAYGGRVSIVEGDTANIKVTLREDIPVKGRPGRDHPGQDHPKQDHPDMLDQSRGAGMRVGVGFDAHRFCEGRPLILGGVEIPFPRGLEGHSDADALTHSLMDAILGALREGDIGFLFPDSDPAYKGVSSVKLLREVVSLMRRRGYELVNADMTIVAEKPRISPHRGGIERLLAAALGTGVENVSLKATTTEKLGFSGREEGIAAESIVLLKAIQEKY